MANDILNLKRFGKYLVSDLRACVSKSGITLGVAAATPAILYFFYGIFHLILLGSWGGASLACRVFFFIVVSIVICIAVPVSCYGKVTDKRSGSQFVMLPVSSFEKTASMIIICCIIAPAVFLACYGALDALICLFDPGCGATLMSFSYLKDTAMLGDVPSEYAESFSAMFNPLLYADDWISFILFFLLGAVWFKSGKVAKTILSFIAISIVMSIATTPMMMDLFRSVMATNDPSLVFERFDWMFRHLGLVDTISDTVGNIVLAVLIFFRVKTIKH